jgi:hypothetical protein
MPTSKLKKASQHSVARAIRQAIGAKTNEPVEIVTPQFTRPKGEPEPARAPEGNAGFDALREADPIQLKALGMRRWGRKEDASGKEFGPMLWLFPGEWYTAIPNGYPITDINFHLENFERGLTDNDIRFGCLSYGILVENDDD